MTIAPPDSDKSDLPPARAGISAASSHLGSAIGALAVMCAVTAMLAPLHEQLSTTTVALLLLLVVLIVATQRGLVPALAASFAGVFGFNYFFLPPIHTLTIRDPENWVALAAFLATAVIAGQLSARARFRAEEAEKGRREIEHLYQELQNAFDRAARAEAERQAERMRSALLDAVTHELRTPLTGIKVSVTALLDDAQCAELSPSDRREMLEIIDEESDRLNRYIGNLVDLAKIEAGKLPIRRTWIAPVEVAREAVARTRGRSSRVDVAVAPDTPSIFVDGRALAEALFMLVDNALKYSPQGSPVHISVYAAAGETVEFAVEDEGPGIPESERGRVFERFYRAEDPETSSPGGTGMGLAIARGIVEAHHGTVTIEDGPDAGGARFVICVPVGDEDAAEPADQPQVHLEEA